MTDRQRHIRLLRKTYEQGGFVRIKMDHRLGGARTGWELRLPTTDQADLPALATALAALGIESGKPYRKGRQQITPIYGRAQVRAFLKLIRPAVKRRIPTLPHRTDLRFKRPSKRRRTSTRSTGIRS